MYITSSPYSACWTKSHCSKLKTCYWTWMILLTWGDLLTRPNSSFWVQLIMLHLIPMPGLLKSLLSSKEKAKAMPPEPQHQSKSQPLLWPETWITPELYTMPQYQDQPKSRLLLSHFSFSKGVTIGHLLLMLLFLGVLLNASVSTRISHLCTNYYWCRNVKQNFSFYLLTLTSSLSSRSFIIPKGQFVSLLDIKHSFKTRQYTKITALQPQLLIYKFYCCKDKCIFSLLVLHLSNRYLCLDRSNQTIPWSESSPVSLSFFTDLIMCRSFWRPMATILTHILTTTKSFTVFDLKSE